MRITRFSLIVVVVGVIASHISNAADYNEWLPLLPTTLDGLPLNPVYDAHNRDQVSDIYSALKCEYKNDTRSITLAITNHLQSYSSKSVESWPEVNTPNLISKKLKIAGYPAVANYTPKDARSYIVVFLFPIGMISAEASPAIPIEQLANIMKDIPYAKIADKLM